MPSPHLPALGLAALLGLTVATLPNQTVTDDPLLWGEICGPEDQWSSAPESPAKLLASLSQGHDAHNLPQSQGPG